MMKNLRLTLLLVFALYGLSLAAQTDQKLTLRSKRTIHLRAGDVHNVELSLQKGQTAIVTVDQVSVGIGYGVYTPSGKLFRFEDLNKVAQKEIIHIFAAETGPYRIQLFWDYDRPQEGDIRLEWVSLVNTPAEKNAKASLLLNAWYPAGDPGVAMAVLQHNKLVFQHTKGVANMEHKVLISASTLFELASVSKQFTGYAMACLIAEGRIQLQDPIGKYLPELPSYKNSVTVEQLIYHTSGIQDWDDILYYMGRQPFDILTTPMILEMAKRSPDLLFTPGERFSYSNTNYNLLAEIIGRVTGEPFAAWMKRKVFIPAGMTTAMVRDADELLIPNKAFAYRANASGFQQAADHTSAIGSTSVHASLNDMISWVQFLNTPSKLPNGVAKLLQRKTILNNGDTLHGYAFGNGFDQHDNESYIEHLGSVSGYRTVVTRYPSQQLSIIYMTNDHNDAAFVRAATIKGIFLGSTDEKSFPPIEFPDLNSSLQATLPYGPIACNGPLAPYAGTYIQDQLETIFTVTVTDKHITVINNRKDSIYLREIGNDGFASNSQLMRHDFLFTKDSAGTVIGFVLKGGEKEIFFRKIR